MIKKHRLLAILLMLTVVLTMSFAAMPAYAADGTAIKTADDLKAMENNPSGSYYLANDIEVPANLSLFTDSRTPFTGTLDGNGHTIKGLTVTRKQGKNTTVYGLFSEITKTAVFENITFEDVSVSVELNNDQNNQINYIGTFAGAVQSGATFTGVTIKGALTYNCFGRDLADKLEVNDLFGEVDSGVDISGITATVTATEVTG